MRGILVALLLLSLLDVAYSYLFTDSAIRFGQRRPLTTLDPAMIELSPEEVITFDEDAVFPEVLQKRRCRFQEGLLSEFRPWRPIHW